MPDFGQTTAESTIVAWLKHEGDRVERGEALADIETDKTTVPVEAHVSGYLRRILHAAGSALPAGTTIALMTSSAAEPVEDEGETRDGPAAAPVAGPELSLPASRPPARGCAPATPAARRLAEEHGIDLALVTGSGPGGRILESDVRALVGKVPAAPKAGASDASAGTRVIPLTPVQRVMATRMMRSTREMPQFALEVDVDVSAIEHLRCRAGDTTKEGLSYTAFIVKAAATALRRHPQLNVSFEDGGLRCHEEVHIGVAVATPRGLLVPVIRNADRKSVEELGTEIAALRAQATEGRLPQAAVGGATFTVSNLGTYGIDRFTALLSPPEAGILAVGRIARRPVLVGTVVQGRPLVTLTLTADHRAVDGAGAAVFLAAVRDLLEGPPA
jgi:pyruvate dehydrogenase E2 component (dihydrolipoamide acetyltransferase)